MTIIVYYCLTNMQSGLSNEILEFLPAAMRWDLGFLLTLEFIRYTPYKTNSRPEGIRRIHLPTCEIWDELCHDREEAWLQISKDNIPRYLSAENALARVD